MAGLWDAEKRSWVMPRIRSRDTNPNGARTFLSLKTIPKLEKLVTRLGREVEGKRAFKRYRVTKRKTKP